MSWRATILALACLQTAWLAGTGQTRADEYRGLIELDPPGPREFVRDLAHLLRPNDKQKIEQAKIDVRLHFCRRHRHPGWRDLARRSVGKLRELKRGGEPERIGRILEEMKIN